MIIVIDVNGEISTDVRDIYIANTCIVAAVGEYESATVYRITGRLGDSADGALNWIDDQIKDQRGASNIVIDMRDCPSVIARF